jgi:hypothetical protein
MNDNLIKLNKEKAAYFFLRKTDQAIIDSLDLVFGAISSSSDSGKVFVYVKTDLTEEQINVLEALDFEVIQLDDNDEEYDEGYKFQISWENASEPNEEEEDYDDNN